MASVDRVVASPAAASEMLVRIKRKRHEPALPEFVLGRKRPHLSDLSICGDATEAAPVPRRVRYRLVGAGGGAAAATEPAAKRERDAAPEPHDAGPGTKREQHLARYKLVELHRAAADSGPDVLELQRCAPDAAARPARPKLVPFGTPIPPSPPKPARAEEADAVDLDAIWAMRDEAALEEAGGGSGDASPGFEAAVAAAAATKAAAAAAAAAEEFVYDEYIVEAGGAPGGGEGPDAEAGVGIDETPELWWEELGDAAVAELEAEWGADDPDDSPSEIDYEDEQHSSDEEERSGDEGIDRRYM